MKNNIWITVIRCKEGENHYSLAKPCRHCHKCLAHYSKTMLHKGVKVWIRYSTGNEKELSCWQNINDITLGNLSSGWREKYRRLEHKII